MHDIYRLPKNTSPTIDPDFLGDDPISRLTKFQKTLLDEVSEFDTADEGKLSIKQKLELYHSMSMTVLDAEGRVLLEELRKDCLTDIADWLTDITVYCRSEAMKFGLPLEDCQDAVMGSNFTKVKGGVPTYDENGKVMKDMSSFVAPEPALKTIIFGVK
jgi:predicted HAD superfamily Cof-like phosphohydrolase